MARFNAAAGGVTLGCARCDGLRANTSTRGCDAGDLTVAVDTSFVTLYASRQKRSTAELVRTGKLVGTGFELCSGDVHQERTSVRMARSATDSSAKSHVPVVSMAVSVVRTCASPSEFCASQRSASSISLVLS
jgi:hypothetical protein